MVPGSSNSSLTSSTLITDNTDISQINKDLAETNIKRYIIGLASMLIMSASLVSYVCVLWPLFFRIGNPQDNEYGPSTHKKIADKY